MSQHRFADQDDIGKGDGVAEEHLHGKASRQDPTCHVIGYCVRVREERFSAPQDGNPHSHRKRPNTGTPCASLASVLPRADWLRTFVITITRDDNASMSIRNACHLLMIAIERNDHNLVEQSLSDVQRTAASEEYSLPVLES